ncbi:MAG: nucleoside triphosphate pyrophosphohydrolase [Myxococcales bacterium]|nr:nucleoside triphosphate pyrophosphohydrolase [Myxococcales bacterium]MDD9971219.1 nucleoside triphosphate pyrophosphohydrolase [Myxococcales bacterium]
MRDRQDGGSLPRLVRIMQQLLGPDGCPWDREQTLQSLRPYVIEEAHEVVEAIDRGRPGELREELGDLLLQIVFQSELARAHGWFGPDDVIAGICDKMERRHPHVFGEEKAATSDDVRMRWEAIKEREKGERGLLDGVPVALPSLLRATKIGQRAARVGLDWDAAEGARAKVSEELAELDQACADGDRSAVERELGDVLFALSNLSRKLDIDPEAALRATLARFAERVGAVEVLAREQDGRALSELTSAELDELWNAVKRTES